MALVGIQNLFVHYYLYHVLHANGLLNRVELYKCFTACSMPCCFLLQFRRRVDDKSDQEDNNKKTDNNWPCSVSLHVYIMTATDCVINVSVLSAITKHNARYYLLTNTAVTVCYNNYITLYNIVCMYNQRTANVGLNNEGQIVVYVRVESRMI